MPAVKPITVDVDLSQFKDRLKELGRRANPLIRRAMYAGGVMIRDAARAKVRAAQIKSTPMKLTPVSNTPLFKTPLFKTPLLNIPSYIITVASLVFAINLLT